MNMTDKTTNSRISRRKLLVTGATSVTVATTMGLSPTLASAHSTNNQPGIATQQMLAENDPFKIRIMASSEMQALLNHYGSKIELSNTIHYKYTHTDTELVAMELKQAGQPNRAVWAYFHPKSNTVSVLQFEFVPTSKMQAVYQASQKLQVSGRATIYAPSGQVISSALFNNDAVIAKTSPVTPSLKNASGCSYWNCFQTCFNTSWNQLPWYIQAACGGACAGCFITATTCWICVGCVSVWAVGCQNTCAYCNNF
jgi:hypothetical protein